MAGLTHDDLVLIRGYKVAFMDPHAYRIGKVSRVYGTSKVTITLPTGKRQVIPVTDIIGVFYGNRIDTVHINTFLIKKRARAVVSVLTENVPDEAK